MNTKKITDGPCVEIYATNNEGTTMIIRDIIGETGMHGTYMNIYNKSMNMGKRRKMGSKTIPCKKFEKCILQRI